MKILFKIFIASFIALLCWEIILELTVIKTPVFKNHPDLGEIYDKYYNNVLHPDYIVIQLNSFDFKEAINNDQSFVYIKKDKDGYVVERKKNYISSNKIRQKFPNLTLLTQIAFLRLGAEKINTLSLFNRINPKINTLNKPENDENVDSKYYEWTIKNLKNSYKNSLLLFLPNVEKDKSILYEETVQEKIIEKYSKKFNLDYINMRNNFVDYRFKYDKPVMGFNNTEPGTGHINAIGHRLVADELTNYFKERINK